MSNIGIAFQNKCQHSFTSQESFFTVLDTMAKSAAEKTEIIHTSTMLRIVCDHKSLRYRSHILYHLTTEFTTRLLTIITSNVTRVHRKYLYEAVNAIYV
jgi:hypothetical protein